MWTAAKILSALIIASPALSIDAPLERGRQEQQSPALHLRIPECDERSALSIKYYYRAPAGGSGGFRQVAGNREYTIELLREGQLATDLRVTIYCLGYQTVTLRHTPIAGAASQTIVIRLERLGTVKLAGHVVLPIPPKDIADLRIGAAYFPWWEHEFFGQPDYALGPFLVASTPLRTDGTFDLTVPDFGHDPVVSSYQTESVLRVDIRNRRTGNPAYDLELAGRPDRAAEVAIAPAYPDLELYALPRR